jgi:ankyrin repeat protein
LEYGADINIENLYGETAIFKTCKSGNKDLVEYLVEHGADINKEEKWYGETPLFYACKSGNKDLVEYLVEHGEDINKEDENGLIPLFYACNNGNINK